MTCYYNWTLENYLTMGKSCYNCPLNLRDCNNLDCIPANGLIRMITVINRQLPGPTVAICENDTIVADVRNLAESTTIHWHGIKQMGTPYMDGVPFVTQCPIPEYTTFRYSFTPTSRDVGTYFWHSHMDYQRTDGTYGMLVIRQPLEDDPNGSLYDYDLTDHVMVVADWPVQIGNIESVEFYDSGLPINPNSLLINGKGRLRRFSDDNGTTVAYTPLALFEVNRGFRYRFRVCSSTNCICPVQFSIDGHNMTIIATDGNPVEPYTVDSFVMNSAERFDFVLDADADVDNYWIKVRGLMECSSLFTGAILRYNGSEDGEPSTPLNLRSSFRSGTILNAIGIPDNGNVDFVNIIELNSSYPDDPSLTSPPDVRYYLPFKLYRNIDPSYYNPVYYPWDSFPPRYQRRLPMIERIAFTYPPSPLLSQYDDVPQSLLCNATSVRRNCSVDFCSCVHRIRLPFGATVELVLIDTGNYTEQFVSHPFHLHGYDFRVVAMEQMDERNTVRGVTALDENGDIRRKLRRAVLKDTVIVPHGGYTVIRLQTDNPGFWAFHCHVELHLETGMMLVFQVGDPSDVPPVPDNFPKCGNFLPDVTK